MKLSIIIPIYNVRDYIKECVESLNAQTLNINDYQVIFVDDGSSDDSVSIIKECINKNLNYQILHKENGGLSDARNFGINNSKSQYVMFVDSDDYVEPTFFEKMLIKIEQTQADFVVCETFWVYENKTTIMKNRNANVQNKKEALDNLFSSSISAWNKIYDRKVFSNNLFTKNLLFEDLDFIFQIIDKYNNVAFLNEPLYYYRQGRKTSILNNSSIKDFTSYDYILSENIKKFKNSEYYKYVEQYYIRRVLLSLSKKYIGTQFEKNLNDIIDKYNSEFKNVLLNYEYQNNSLPVKFWIKKAWKKQFYLLKIIKKII